MRKLSVVAPVLFLLGFAAVSAQQVDVPVRNWVVPPYTAASGGGGITTMTDVTSPRAFVAVAPCRLADTRAIDGFTGQAGGPALSSFANRNFVLTGSPAGVPAPPAGCATGTIPATADAVSLQFTIVTPTASGNLVAWNAGGSIPNVSVLNWDAGTVAQGSGTIVPIGGSGAITVRLNTAAAGQTAHLVIDVNGYFGDSPVAPSNPFILINSSNLYTMALTNNSTVCTGGCGLLVQVAGGHAIQAHSATTGVTYGVWGNTASGSNNAAGVKGSNGSLTTPGYSPAGVRGEGGNFGVLGISNTEGVGGSLISGVNELAWGALGFDAGTPNYGVYAGGDYGGSGAKSFVDPHPTDPSKVVRYISLEGAEPGTYFRGKGRFQRGMARIPVPEDFRMVTDADGLTVQVTPIGPMATVSVVRFDLNEIVVQSSRNVEFFYLVNGIRRTHKHRTSPIGDGNEFMPRSADSRIPAYLTEGQKQLLIQNGTYREDGSVNVETARRLGWDRIWAERERPSPAPPSD
jgi:hypothetical protein